MKKQEQIYQVLLSNSIFIKQLNKLELDNKNGVGSSLPMSQRKKKSNHALPKLNITQIKINSLQLE